MYLPGKIAGSSVARLGEVFKHVRSVSSRAFKKQHATIHSRCPIDYPYTILQVLGDQWVIGEAVRSFMPNRRRSQRMLDDPLVLLFLDQLLLCVVAEISATKEEP